MTANIYFMFLNWSRGFKCHIPKTAHVASASKRGFDCVPHGDKMCHNMCITCVTVMLILSWQYVLYREERNCLSSSHVPANLILIVSIAVIGDKMYLLIACVTTYAFVMKVMIKCDTLWGEKLRELVASASQFDFDILHHRCIIDVSACVTGMLILLVMMMWCYTVTLGGEKLR